MTGPEHYQEAEYLLAMSVEQRAAILAKDPTAGDPAEPDRIVALAQVHATLALAAATALSGGPMAHADDVAWTAAAGATLDISGQQQ